VIIVSLQKRANTSRLQRDFSMGFSNTFLTSLTLGLLLMCAGCGGHTVKPPALSVSIIDTGSQQTISYEQLLQELAGADYLLLGEEHDQALHHSKRAELIRSLAAMHPLLVSFEHVGGDLQELLVANLDKPETLRRVLDWDNSGWPEWPLFLPLFKAVADTKALVVAGMISGDSDLSDYGLGSTLSNQAQLEALLRDSHPPSVKVSIERMILAQRKRDAGMARSLDSKLNPKEPKRIRVLLAGNGHVRKDFGVPWYLAFKHPEAAVLSVGFITNGQKDQLSLFDFVVLFEEQSDTVSADSIAS
jgi:uncharacterized iron-regulated protein